MTRIRVLPEELINRIAAGEVVDRPASAAKELIENAIDAGATSIVVEIRRGGRALLKVTDNGCGMSRDDAILSLERHATSKLPDEESINAILTMGFRGEAVPAIAAVSRVTLETRPASRDLGTLLRVEGGRIESTQDAPMNPGTSFEVRDLYFNTPARRKFLKSPGAETTAISDVVANAALAWTRIGFKLMVQGKPSILSPGNGSLQDAAEPLFGRDLVRGAILIESTPIDQTSVTVRGLVTPPGMGLPTRRGLRLFVNQRPIRSASLSRAILNAYRNALPIGKSPLALLFLEVPPADVDVNIHPGKLEVRLEQQKAVEEGLMRLIRSRLSGHRISRPLVAHVDEEVERPPPGDVEADLKALFGLPRPPPRSGYAGSGGRRGQGSRGGSSPQGTLPLADIAGETTTTPVEDQRQVDAIEGPSSLLGRPVPRQDRTHPGASGRSARDAVGSREHPEGPLSRDQTVAWDTHGEGTCDAAEDHPPFLVPGSSDLKPVVGDMDWACMTVLCQLFRTYILGTDGDHFFVMDQHVAHERILFEQALARFEKGDTVVQPLLIPREMNLPQQTTERVLQHRGLLQEHGFDISSGMDGITIRSVPVISDRVDPVSLLEDLIGDLDERGTATQLDRLHRRLSATIACRSAYMSGDEIDGAEMTRLVRDLAMTDNPMTCPHGRPSVLVISRQELDRRFLRI